MLLKTCKWIVLLIQQVKQRTILYDPYQSNRKNYATKEKAWQEIAQKLNISVYRAKAKWKSLRDMYVKHLKAISSEEMSEKYKAYKRWRWAKYMAFMRPIINGTGNAIYSHHKAIDDLAKIKVEGESSNDGAYTEAAEFIEIRSKSEDRKQELVELKDHIQEEHCYVEECDQTNNNNNDLMQSSSTKEYEKSLTKTIHISHTKKQKQSNLNRPDKEGLNYLVESIQNKPKRQKEQDDSTYEDEHQTNEEAMQRRQRKQATSNYTQEIDNEMQLDAIEHIFIGYAKTIKTLPLKSQISVKIKIAKLIMEEEIKLKAVKSKWKSLRECYIKHLRAITKEVPGIRVKSYKKWPWARYLHFLRPYVAAVAGIEEVTYRGPDADETIENIRIDIKAADEEDKSNDVKKDDFKGIKGLDDSNNYKHNEQIPAEEVHPPTSENNTKRFKCESSKSTQQYFVVEPDSTLVNKKRKRPNSNHGEDEEDFVEQGHNNTRQMHRKLAIRAVDFKVKQKTQLDAIEHLFIGYAKTVKKLPLKNQIHLKMEIAKLVTREEIRYLK